MQITQRWQRALDNINKRNLLVLTKLVDNAVSLMTVEEISTVSNVDITYKRSIGYASNNDVVKVANAINLIKKKILSIVERIHPEEYCQEIIRENIATATYFQYQPDLDKYRLPHGLFPRKWDVRQRKD